MKIEVRPNIHPYVAVRIYPEAADEFGSSEHIAATLSTHVGGTNVTLFVRDITALRSLATDMLVEAARLEAADGVTVDEN